MTLYWHNYRKHFAKDIIIMTPYWHNCATHFAMGFTMTSVG